MCVCVCVCVRSGFICLPKVWEDLRNGFEFNAQIAIGSCSFKTLSMWAFAKTPLNTVFIQSLTMYVVYTVVLQLTSCYKHNYSPGVICCLHVDMMLWDAFVGNPLESWQPIFFLPQNQMLF